ncbi:metallopeptidase [soil metagenome]
MRIAELTTTTGQVPAGAALGVLLLVVASTVAAASAGAGKKEVFESEREVIEVEGWEVEMDVRLLRGDPESVAKGEKVMKVLGGQLFLISELVPHEAVRALQKTRIVVELENPDRSGIEYHPHREWLQANGHSDRLWRTVHISALDRFLSAEMRATQPMVILHELSHAYHDQVLGFDEPEIRAAWERAKAAGTLEKVAFIRGGERRHYALVDHKEFFAEMTEAYFGTNDFFPFVKGELEAWDAETAKLMGNLWKVK